MTEGILGGILHKPPPGIIFHANIPMVTGMTERHQHEGRLKTGEHVLPVPRSNVSTLIFSSCPVMPYHEPVMNQRGGEGQDSRKWILAIGRRVLSGSGTGKGPVASRMKVKT